MADILLIDDDPLVIKVFTAYLEKAGHTVTCAANGLEGLQLLGRYRFDLIVTDILMPERDGIELLLHLRKQADKPKIIAVSGGSPTLSHTYVLELAKTVAADRVLQKPVDYETLTRTVQELLQS